MIEFIELELGEAEIKKRLKARKRPEPRIRNGFLGEIYTKIVDSVDKGAILKIR